MSPNAPVRAVIFDLGDVLFTWSSKTNTTITSAILRKILSSTVWFEYECGHLPQSACYERIGEDFSVKASQVAEAFAQARESLQPDDKMLAFLKGLKETTSVKAYAMSNVGREDFASLSKKMDWSLFDRVFTSGDVGMRKPDLGFFRHVLEEIGLDSEQVVFVDDKRENVLAADGLGIRSIVFDDCTVQTLQALLDTPISRAFDFLYRNAKHLDSITDSGVVIPDNFAQLLILEAIQDR